jgi:tetratricopeptide (TPR) repeat protein
MTSWLRAISRRAASLSPAHRRRRRREAERAERLSRQDEAIQELLAQQQFLAQLQGLRNLILEKLGEGVTVDDVVQLDAIVAAALHAPTAEKRTEILVGGIAAQGLRFSTYVGLSAQLDPDRYGDLDVAVHEVVEAWARGRTATDRADEQDARARYFLDAIEQQPSLVRIAAGAVLALPPGHPLRDEGRIRRSLEDMLRQAIEGAVGVGADGPELEPPTEHALLAMSGLIQHELVDRERVDSLLATGRLLLASPHIGSGGETYRMAVGGHLIMRAKAAREKGETALADHDAAEAASLLEPLMAAETDPVPAQLLPMLLQAVVGGSEGILEAMETLSSISPADRQELRAALTGALRMAQEALAEGDHQRAVEILSPILTTAEHRFMSAVLDVDVAEAGEAMADIATTLSFAHAHQGAFGKAAEVLDRAKSLRFRYQAMVRSSPLGELAGDLEADIHAASRGLSPAGGQKVAELLETYRQLREKIPPEGLERPGVAEVASVLGEDEAVAILGEAAHGLLLMVIRPGNQEEPSHGEVRPPEDVRRLIPAMIDRSAGWIVALAANSLIEPRRSIVQLLRTADEVLGARIAQALEGAGVRRLTVIPHNLLQLIPWWALPSLASFEVMVASSAGQLVADRHPGETSPPHALVVSDPTGDLPLATIEGSIVAAHLSQIGWSVDPLPGVEATEEAVAERAGRSGIVHFAGHSRSDMTAPARSALEVHPVPNEGTGGEPDDDLLELAGSVEWQAVRKLAGTEWLDIPNEDQADVPERGHLARRLRVADESIELRLEHGPSGTLLGQYELAGSSDDGGIRYGRRLRLSELWTAGDLLIGHGFRRCGLVFLSSCEAGLGQLGQFDEFAGLPAALQLAGASAVVSSLWPVEEETAAVFADLFYQALAEAQATGRPVDLLSLVHLTRQRLRTMTREEATAILGRLRERAGDPLTRFRLEGRIVRLGDLPFSHPYEWAAFQVTGSPVPPLPTSTGDSTASVRTLTPTPSTTFELPPPDLEPTPGSLSGGRDDPFSLGSAAETILAATDDPAVRKLAGEFLYERGAAHLRAGDRAEAELDLARALEADPDHVAARLTLARTSLAQGDLQAAARHAEAVLVGEPRDTRALLVRGLAREGLGKVAAARHDLDAALAASPDEATAFATYRTRARVRAASNELPGAIEDLTEAIALRPEDPDPYLDRARTLMAADDWEAALADADRARLFLPDADTCLDVRGLALLNTGRPDEAVAALERAIELNPNGAGYHYHLGLALADAGRDDQALTEFGLALESDPMPSIHTDRGLVHARMGRYDLALAEYEETLRLDPRHIAARYNRACAYSLKAERGTIVDDLRAVFAAEPALRDHARSDADLEWARGHLPEVAEMLVVDPST